MMSGWLSFVWRRLGKFQFILLWTINSKFTVGASAVILNERGEVWLQKHRFWSQQAWGLPGGHVEYGETPAAALVREVKEETGMHINNLQLLMTETPWSRELVVYYKADFAGGTLQLDSHEVMSADFYALDNLPKPLLKSHRKILSNLDELLRSRTHEG
jgi:mutator protein MutT